LYKKIVYSQIENGIDFNFIFAIEDQFTNSVILGKTLVHYDNININAEMSDYSFFKYPNSEIPELKKSEVQLNIEKYLKQNFTIEKTFLYDNILGDNYYLAMIKNSIGQIKYYIFSEQKNNKMEYELDGLFSKNDFSDKIKDLKDCCCINDNNKWELYEIDKINNKCPEMKICTISLKDLCEYK